MSQKTLVYVVLYLFVTGCSSSPVNTSDVQTPADISPDVSQSAVVELGERFCAQVERLVFELPYRPEMREWTRPSVISWREEARAVAIPKWEKLEPKTRELFTEIGDGKFFEWAFRWFFPAHELAHFIQAEFGWQGDHATSERMANDVAVAFHMTQPRGPERLQRFYKWIAKAVELFPDPTPAGNDPDKYFHENYKKLGIKKFAAYQFGFALDSLNRRHRLEFDKLVYNIARQSSAPTAVMLDSALDVGFHVAAHLHLPDVAITLHDPEYIRQVADFKKQNNIPDRMLDAKIQSLSTALNDRWHVHRLVRVPALFSDFEDTKLAFKYLTDPTSPIAQEESVYKRLNEYFLELYPKLKNLSKEDKELGREIVTIIEYEFDAFFQTFHETNRTTWDEARRRFRDNWYEEIAPAIAVLDPNHSMRQIVIILSPALRRHGKSYRIRNQIGRVATLLPGRKEEMEHALLYAFHEMCHGISDPLVYESGYNPKNLSFKHGEKGQELHSLIEAAANQAMFEALGATNPDLRERFLIVFGGLRWLATKGLLKERTELAGHSLSDQELEQLNTGLNEKPIEFSRILYEQGLLVPEQTLKRLRGIIGI